MWCSSQLADLLLGARPAPPRATSAGAPADSPWIWVAAVALALVVAAAVALSIWALRRRKRRRVRRRELKLKYPVVLAHGVLGFNEVRLLNSKHAYFRGVATRLNRVGAQVHKPEVHKSASIAVRAQQLADAIKSVDAKKVNVIAHSMGGLDARFAISQLGMAERIATLVTVGTPHQGTPLADLSTDLFGEKLLLRKALGALGIETEAFYDLTVTRMKAFNREVEDDRRVTYSSVVATAPSARAVNKLLLPSYLYLKECEGENDGLITARSQEWGEVLTRIHADHWAQIGWSKHFDAADFYEDLLRELRARGF